MDRRDQARLPARSTVKPEAQETAPPTTSASASVSFQSHLVGGRGRAAMTAVSAASAATRSPMRPNRPVVTTSGLSPASAGSRYMSSAGLMLQQFEQQDQASRTSTATGRYNNTTATSSSANNNESDRNHNHNHNSQQTFRHASTVPTATTSNLGTPTVTPIPAATAASAPTNQSSHVHDIRGDNSNSLLRYTMTMPDDDERNASYDSGQFRRPTGGNASISGSTISTISMDSMDNASLRSYNNNHNNSASMMQYNDPPPQTMLTIPGRPQPPLSGAPPTVMEEGQTTHSSMTPVRTTAKGRLSTITAVASNLTGLDGGTSNHPDLEDGPYIPSSPTPVPAPLILSATVSASSTPGLPSPRSSSKPGIQRSMSVTSNASTINTQSQQTSPTQRFDQRCRQTKSGTSASFVGRDHQMRLLNNAIDQIFKAHAKAASTGTTAAQPITASSLQSHGQHHKPQRRRSMQQVVRPHVARANTSDDNSMMINASSSAAYNKAGGGSDNSFVVQKSPPLPRTWMVVSGPSGCGKSSLLSRVVKQRHAKQQQQQQVQNNNGFFVKISLEEYHKDEPLPTIQLFLVELCHQIASNKKACDFLSKELQTSLGIMECTVFQHILSKSLYDTLFTENRHSSSSNSRYQNSIPVNINFQHWQYQFQNAILQFLYIVTSYMPVVWITDNMQYSSMRSLELMMTIIQTTTLPYLAIITCHDSAEANRNSVIQTMYQQLEQSKRTRSIRLVFITVDYWEMDQIQEWLEDHLLDGGMNAAAVAREFAEYLYDMTQGNIVYIEQLIRAMLQMEVLAVSSNGNSNAPPSSSLRYEMADSMDNIRTSIQRRIKLQSPPSLHEFWKLLLKETDLFASPSATTLSSLRGSSPSTQKSHAQHVLSLIACLNRQTFSHSIVQTILNGFCVAPHDAFFRHNFQFPASVLADSIQCSAVLKLCQQEGWIYEVRRHNRGVNRYYRFQHESIQQAALPSSSNVSEFQYRIGDILYSSHNHGGGGEDDLLISSTNLMNVRLDLIPRDQYGAASKNNFLAAVQCSSLSCYTEYFKTAIRLLPQTMSDEGDVTKARYFIHAAQCAEDAEQMKLYCSTVMDMQTSLQNLQAYPIYMESVLKKLSNISIDYMIKNATQTNTMIMNTISQQQNNVPKPASSSLGAAATMMAGASSLDSNNIIDMGIQILTRLGIHFPNNNKGGRVVGRLLSSKILNVDRMESIQSLKLATNDPEHQMIMTILDKMILASYFMKPDYMPTLLVRSVRRTIEHGITNESPPAFALLGLLLTYFQNDFYTGKMYAEHAISMMRQPQKSSSSSNKKSFVFTTEARTMYTCYGMVLNWTQPWETCRGPLLDAYHVGMSSGDVESAMWCMYYYLDSSWNTGSSLMSLDRDFMTYTKACQDTRQPLQYMCLAMNWQIVLNLRGLSTTNRRTVLSGDAFDERIILQRSASNKNSSDLSLLQLILKRYKLYAALYFGEWEVACSIGMSIIDEYCKKLPGQSGCIYVTYISGLAALAVSKFKSKEKKYRRHGRKCRNKLKEWADRGNPNCIHFVAMLDGEYDASRGMADTAGKHFEVAIKLAGRRGIVQDQAIANERLAESWLYHGDSDNAKYRFVEALRLYGEWGADRKVELLRERCRKVWKKFPEIEENR